MLLFIDTANITEIRRYNFLLYGVTTTPTIIKRDASTSDDFMQQVRSEFPELEVHVEALAKNYKETLSVIRDLCQKPWYNTDKVVFKVPISLDGLKATKIIKEQHPDIKINLHMAFSVAQASLSFLANPDYVSPLIGRYAASVANQKPEDDTISSSGNAGHELLEGIIQSKYGLKSNCKILSSSIRTVEDFVESTKLGSDAVTLPPAVLKDALEHPMTDQGVSAFWKDLT